MKVAIDKLGRMVIPKGIRKRLGIEWFDELIIDIDNDKIVIMKENSTNKLTEFIEELKQNSKVNSKINMANRINIDYVIDRLEEILNER